MKYHLTAVKMAVNPEEEKPVQRGCGKKGTLIHIEEMEIRITISGN